MEGAVLAAVSYKENQSTNATSLLAIRAARLAASGTTAEKLFGSSYMGRDLK
jgi:hypothetical protein